MTEKLLNSSVKKPLEASPNTQIFSNAINQEPIDIKEMDLQNDNVTPVYVDKFIRRQASSYW